MKRLFLTAALTLAPLAAAALPIGPFDEIVVFGDSLSDPGNAFVGTNGQIPPMPFFPNGQFTNGDVWSSQLGATVTRGTNVAVGGAKARTDGDISPDFTAQRAIFQSRNLTLGNDPLTFVFFGANDMRDATDATLTTVVADAVTEIVTGVTELVGFGLTDIIVMNLPNLGRVPEVFGTFDGQIAEGATQFFNNTLAGAIQTANSRTPANIEIFDTFSLFEDFATDAEANGLIVDISCEDDLTRCLALGPDQYLWYDAVHPTEGFHSALAGQFAPLVTDPLFTPAPVPLPAGVLLLLTALGGLALAKRRATS